MYTTNLTHAAKPFCEFLWSEDMADACVFIIENIDFNDLKSPLAKGDKGGLIPEKQDEKSATDSSHSLGMTNPEIRNTHINIGSGEEISIKQLAELIKNQVGFSGGLIFNAEKPDGTMRKITDVTKLNKLGWEHTMSLDDGVKKLVEWYLKPTK